MLLLIFLLCDNSCFVVCLCFKTKSIHGNNIIAISTENVKKIPSVKFICNFVYCAFCLFFFLANEFLSKYKCMYVADRLFNPLYQRATGCLQNQSYTLQSLCFTQTVRLSIEHPAKHSWSVVLALCIQKCGSVAAECILCARNSISSAQNVASVFFFFFFPRYAHSWTP